MIHRVVVPDIDTWKQEEAQPAEPIVELPVYRRENGLWAHQKSFIKLAFDAHKNGGARYLLADQVGLGKTVQLALASALRDEEEAKRIIATVPKRHPFEMRYDRIENVDWESCSRVLDSASQLEALREGW